MGRIVVACVAGFSVACTAACSSSSIAPTATAGAPNITASPAPPVAALLVFTNWVADAKVTYALETGFKPALTGLTGHDVVRAVAASDVNGGWVVNVSFSARGADLLKKLTGESVAACSGNCAQRHLGIWLDLTQTDIDNWEDSTYAARVGQPFDFGCLAQMTSTSVCPKLISNPVILQEIDGGSAAVTGGLTRQSASDLAIAINLGSHS